MYEYVTNQVLFDANIAQHDSYLKIVDSPHSTYGFLSLNTEPRNSKRLITSSEYNYPPIK